ARARAEPLLRLRRGRAAGAARRVDRARADRPRPVALRLSGPRTSVDPESPVPMRLLVILDPLPLIKTYKDSTYAMMVEAAARGPPAPPPAAQSARPSPRAGAATARRGAAAGGRGAARRGAGGGAAGGAPARGRGGGGGGGRARGPPPPPPRRAAPAGEGAGG